MFIGDYFEVIALRCWNRGFYSLIHLHGNADIVVRRIFVAGNHHDRCTGIEIREIRHDVVPGYTESEDRQRAQQRYT